MTTEQLDLPSVERPEVGKVLTSFPITPDLIEQATKYVTDSKAYFESQRESKAENDTNRKSWSERLEQQERAYRALLEPDRPYKGFNDVASPIIHDNTELVVSRLKESILACDIKDLVEIEAQPTQLAKMREQQIAKQFEQQDIEDKVDNVCRDAVKYGTAIIKVPFVNEENVILTQQLVTITEQIPIIDEANQQMYDSNGQPMFHVEQRQELQIKPEIDRKYFGPGYQIVDIENFYADYFIEDMQSQPIVVHEFLVDWSHLEDGVKKGIYFENKVKELKDAPADNEMNWNNRSENIVGGSMLNSDRTSQGQPKEYKMLQAYAKMEIPVGKDENGNTIKEVHSVVIAVVNDICIQLMQNPYFHQMIPFVKVPYRKIPGEFYGMSAIDPVLGMYQHYNDVCNQINDGNIITLNPITITKAGAIADKQDFNVAPGKIWYEKETGDIRPYVISWDAGSAQQYLELLEQRINRGMGITPLMQGAYDKTDVEKTWRGTNKLISQADKKFMSIALSIEDACIRQVAELFYKVNCQFTPIVGATGEFENINGEVNFRVVGVRNYFKKHEDIENYLMAASQLAAIPGFNIPALAYKVTELMNLEIDEAKFGPIYTPPQPLPPPEEPLKTSTSIPLDPSKGPVMLFAAAQLLKQKGIDLDIDSIAEATAVFINEIDPDAKAQSGVLPPSYDSYQEGDKRAKRDNTKSKA